MEMRMYVDKGMMNGKRKNEMLHWCLLKNGTLQVTGIGAMPDFEPESEENIRISPWYEYSHMIKNVVVGEDITEIGSNAFAGCEELVSVALPESMKRICYCAFAGCTKLTEVQTVPGVRFVHVYDAAENAEGTVIKMGIHAFAQTPFARAAWGDFCISEGVLLDYLGSDEYVRIPSDVTEIGTMAFSGCGIAQANLPEGILKISAFAFAQTRLERIEFPISLTAIEYGAFADIPNTLEVVCPQNAEGTIAVNEHAFLDTKISIAGKKKLPELYKLELKSADKIKGYKKMQMKEDNISIGNPKFNAGHSIMRRIERASSIICISYDTAKELVRYADCYTWDADEKMMKCSHVRFYSKWIGHEEKPAIWNIVETKMDKKQFLEGFKEENARTLQDEGQIRSCERNCREEWFRADDGKEDVIVSVLKLMYQWLNVHKDYRLKKVEELR